MGDGVEHEDHEPGQPRTKELFEVYSPTSLVQNKFAARKGPRPADRDDG